MGGIGAGLRPVSAGGDAPRREAGGGPFDAGGRAGDAARRSAADQRRAGLLQALRAAARPVPARELAGRFGVSRQVVVQDVAILRAEGHPILATPAGYVVSGASPAWPYRAVVAVRHGRDDTEAELLALVEAGVRVVDVIVEHPLYGELRGVLMLETPDDVRRFMERLRAEGIQLLSSLTGGLHLHTLEARHPEALERARAAMARLGFLVSADS